MQFLWPRQSERSSSAPQYIATHREAIELTEREADEAVWWMIKFFTFWAVVGWFAGFFQRRKNQKPTSSTDHLWMKAAKPCEVPTYCPDCAAEPADITVTIHGGAPPGGCDVCLTREALGTAIKAARIAAGWKLRHQFSVAFGIPPGVQGCIELGKVTPRPDHIAVYTTVLGMPRSLFANNGELP